MQLLQIAISSIKQALKTKKSSSMLNFKRKSHEVYYADPALFCSNDHHILPELAAIPTLKQCEKQQTKGTDRAN
jgi:hypothetical protein